MLVLSHNCLAQWHKGACQVKRSNGKLKLNTDGSVKWRSKKKDGSVRYINSLRAGFGGILIRNEGGSLIVGFYGRFKYGCEVLETERCGGLKIIRGCNLRVVEIESDSKPAIHLIKDETAYNLQEVTFQGASREMQGDEAGDGNTYTLREGNRVADKLAKRERDRGDKYFTIFTTPPNGNNS